VADTHSEIPTETRTATLKRLDKIERSLTRYGCFDLVEEDVEWLIATLRLELRRRCADT